MSFTNAAISGAFQSHPLAIGATIDPMGMIKLHFGALPVFSGPGQRWTAAPGGRYQEIGLSELGGMPGFEASSSFMANPLYSGPPVQGPMGGIRTTAQIQAEARMKADGLLAAQTAKPVSHPGDRGLEALGLPPQPELTEQAHVSAINAQTPVEGLVSTPQHMKTQQAPRPAPVVDHLAAALQGSPVVSGVSARDMLAGLILALDIGFNGQGDLAKMRSAVAAMADAVRKGGLRD